jgi:hypothetical protein
MHLQARVMELRVLSHWTRLAAKRSISPYR